MKTFPSPEVKPIIEKHFVFVEVDVGVHKEEAKWLGVNAIPDVFILSLDGKKVAHRLGFVEPADFAAWLGKHLE